MSTTTLERRNTKKPLPRSARRFGYAVAIGMNAIGLWLLHNLVDWGWPPFLTGDFNTLLGVFNAVVGVSIAVNLAYLFFDPPPFKAFTQVIVNIVSLYAGVRIYQVFPFDFSEYTFNWDLVARIVIVLGIVATGIGVITELVKLVRSTDSVR